MSEADIRPFDHPAAKRDADADIDGGQSVESVRCRTIVQHRVWQPDDQMGGCPLRSSVCGGTEA